MTLVGGASVMWPLSARAQPSNNVRRIGLLMGWSESDLQGKARVAALLEKLRELGWAEGRNLSFHLRSPGPEIEKLSGPAKELVALQPDLLIASPTTPVIALARETSSIPIVFVSVTDPIGNGFVTNLAHPGGNITGFTNFAISMGEKWLQLIKEIAPNVTSAGVLYNPSIVPTAGLYLRSIEVASPSFAIEISSLPVRDTAEMESAIRALAAKQNVALIVASDVFMSLNRERIVALAAELRLPAIYPFGYFAKAGGLISYGIDSTELFPLAATYADRILKGAKPGDLPIQRPTKFELIINLKAAKALGLEVPTTLLAGANEVIE